MSTVLHQLDTPGKGIFGMSYVVQTDDGSTVVVDGGFNKDDAEYLLAYLKKVTGREKPVVDAWFITHNHADHTYCFMSMAENHAADIEVLNVVFCFLSDEFYKNCQEATVAERHRFSDCIKKFGSQIIEPVPGDVFTFGSARIEILYTARQLPVVDGGRGNELNDTSLVFRLYAEGQSVLFLGDVQKAADDVMIALYGKSLKSDVVQLAHHGEFSSTAEFYSYVDPDIVLWPMDMKGIDGRLYSMITSSDANRTLLCDLHVKDVFIAGFGTVRFELPIKPCVAPFWTGDVDSLRSCIPSYTLVRLEGMPSGIDDPLWGKAGKIRLDFCKKAATPVYADLRLFWNETGVGVKAAVSGLGCEAPSDPDSFKYENCCNVRLHFSEEPVYDFAHHWEDEMFNAFRDLRLYPEKKNVVPGGAFNNMPDKFSSIGRPTPDGFEVCAFIPFRGERKKGDAIGLHTEVSFNFAPGETRAPMLTLAKGLFNEIYRATPSGLVWFRLG